MRLDAYFARRFAVNFLGLFAVFTIFYGLIDMIEEFRRFDTATVGFFGILQLTALNLPEGLYGILPLIVILATISMFLGLARSSEMVVTRSAGRSALRSLASPVVVAFVLGLLAITVFNPIVAATTKQYEVLSNRYRGNESTVSVTREGLWLRQGSDQGQTVIRAERGNLDGTKLFNVSFLTFGPDGLPTVRIEAKSAELVVGAWDIRDAKEWNFRATANPEKDAITVASLTMPSDLTREQIRDSFGTPSAIPIWELPGFIERLERAGFSARIHRVWLEMELALPLMLSAMVMIGAGFTMRHTRFGQTGVMVLLALMSGFTIYFIRNFAKVLGENGQIPVELAAWAPPVAAILLTLGLLLHLEDG